MDVAKQANQVIKKALKQLKDKKDIAVFEKDPDIFNDAAGMVNGNKMNEALLKGWMVAEANKIVFLLWRRGALTDEVVEEYRKLPATEEAIKDYDELQKEDKKVADALEAERRKYMATQQELDIFKAVLNGTPKEKAVAQFNEYKKQLEQAVQGR